MSDLVFAVKNIFSTDSKFGALGQQEVEKFYIAPYQRGYKWASDNENAPVWVLMTDLLDAFRGDEKEYFLQYITVKKNQLNGTSVLEVIDGQQRLTTLTLLFSVLASRKDNKEPAITDNKLSYKVRPIVDKFFRNFVYKEVKELFDMEWIDFTNEYPEYNEQDIFFLFEAIKRINLELSSDDILMKFETFVTENVKIILNNIDKGNISSERIFSNLNTNKVDLTGVELIKGLLLTKTAREVKHDNEIPHYKEILETRAAIGRQWDEMTNWAEGKRIKKFYFTQYSEPIEGILTLVALSHNYKEKQSKGSQYPLFNFYQRLLNRDHLTASDLFGEIREFYNVLRDWQTNKRLYNLLGFLFFNGRIDFKFEELSDLIRKKTNEVEKVLSTKVLELLPDDSSTLEYGVDNDAIQRVLLAISVFGNDQYFDYVNFAQNDWSLEHVFPQNPEKISDTLQHNDIKLIKSLKKENWKKEGARYLRSINFEKEDAETKIEQLFQKLKQETCEVDSIEKEIIYELIETTQLNKLGNMALLTGKVNTSVGNGMFDAKRFKIVKMVSKGEFVPKHTYDVFSKLLSEDFNPNLTVWTENDIEVHTKWIVNKVREIKSELSYE
ncbi:DUF262 domain-containing protein [Draconibacterium orientale]|uniref:DUF262 domain-containing protein n=1 Tax=Draconibacterium orientale TaxID=1168034 RepID=UPI0029C01CC7|nr:DUF262 domain-containing protein [Draconibacterium orientale]